jgi:hypothetical protein
MDLFEFFIDAHLVLLELFHLFENFLALATASIDKSISSSTPVESLNTWLNCTIKLIKVLLEKEFLLEDILFL